LRSAPGPRGLLLSSDDVAYSAEGKQWSKCQADGAKQVPQTMSDWFEIWGKPTQQPKLDARGNEILKTRGFETLSSRSEAMQTTTLFKTLPPEIDKGISALPGLTSRNMRQQKIEARATARAARNRASIPFGMKKKPRLCPLCLAQGAECALPCEGSHALKRGNNKAPVAVAAVEELRVDLAKQLEAWFLGLNRAVTGGRGGAGVDIRAGASQRETMTTTQRALDKSGLRFKEGELEAMADYKVRVSSTRFRAISMQAHPRMQR
jgi:hypothetical protein